MSPLLATFGAGSAKAFGLSRFLQQDLGDFESIETISVGNASSVTFSSIPQTYENLQIRFYGKANVSSGYAQNISLRLNGDSSSNYARHTLQAYAGGYSAFTVFGDANQNAMYFASGLTSISHNSSTFGIGIIDVLDYKNVNKNTTVRCLSGAEMNDSGSVQVIALSSGHWRNTSAVDSITLFCPNGNFVNSKFALYGIKE